VHINNINLKKMSRYLGIDYGDKRIGIAISDEEGKFAFPNLVIRNEKLEVGKKIKKIIQEYAVKIIIIGLPQNFKGEDTKQTKSVRSFAEQLKKEFPRVEIVFQNEILTSKQIDKSGGATKSMQDASAAALILQSFLDRKRSGV